MDENAIADCFDDEVACCTPKALTRKRARKRLLANAIETTGIAGLSVLEIGSGVGELTRELVRRGAASATGIDLSPQSVAIAMAAARDEGLAGRVSFEVGNGATQPLEPYDVVVLDRVICCYPKADELVPHTAAAARRAYAFVLPRNEGALQTYWRVRFAIENTYHALRGRRFRAYLHDIDLIDRWLHADGFSVGRRFSRQGWLHAVYLRRDDLAQSGPIGTEQPSDSSLGCG